MAIRRWLAQIISRSPCRSLSAIVTSVLLIGFSLSSPVDAATMKRLGLAELVETSDLIVRGDVQSRETFKSSETGRIKTHTSIRIDETYMGKPGRDVIAVEQLGGTIGETTVEIPGDATFTENDQVLLFLDFNRGPTKYPLYLTAMAQSAFFIHREGSKRWVTRNMEQVKLVGSSTDEEIELPQRLNSFIPRLRSLIYAIKGGQQ